MVVQQRLGGARVAGIDEWHGLNVFESGTDAIVAESVSSDTAVPFASLSVVSFRADGNELLLGTTLGETSRWSAKPLSRLGDWTSPQTPFNDFTPGYSGDRAWFGYLKFGITVTSTAEGSSGVRNYPLQTRSDASALAISPDASRVAVASEGTISVVQEEIPHREPGPPGQRGGLVTDPLSGVGTTVTGPAFVGGSQLLVSASQRTLALWDLRQQSRIATPTGVDLPDQTEGSFVPELAVSLTGKLHAWVNESGELTVARPPTVAGPRHCAGRLPRAGLWSSSSLRTSIGSTRWHPRRSRPGRWMAGLCAGWRPGRSRSTPI